MNIEQGCQSLSRFDKCDGWKSTGRVLSVHILLNDRGSFYVGLFRKEIGSARLRDRYLSVLPLIKCGERYVRFLERGADFRAGQRI